MDLILGAVEDICRTKKVRQEQADELESSRYAFIGKSKLYCKVFRGHTGSVSSCQFFHTDKYILSSSEDSTAKIWNVAAKECTHTFCDNQSLALLGAHVAPDDNSFVTAGLDKRLLHWSLETNQVMWQAEHNGIVMCCRISHNGQLLASGSDSDHELKIWDFRTAKPVHRLSDLHSNGITSVKFTSQEDKISSTSMDRTIQIFDLKSCKKTLKLYGHKNIVSNCAFDANNRNLATTGWDKWILIWDVATGKYRLALGDFCEYGNKHEDNSPNNGPVSLLGHEGSISSCVFSQDGQYLISGSYDESIIIWDLKDNTERIKINEHTGWVEDVGISQNQEWLVSCSKDQTVRIWNIKNINTIQRTNKSEQNVTQIMQCEKCLKPFIPAPDIRGHNLLMCLYCKLDLNAEKESKSSTNT